MQSLKPADADKLKSEGAELDKRYSSFVDQKLSLDMTRGKPCPEQLDLSLGMLTLVGPDDYRAADGTDCRNYGGIDGLPEMKKLFADFLEVSPSEVLIGDNSSLMLMHDTVARAMSHGVPGGDGPWSKGKVRFLCPVPGYDRHFTVCEHFGIEMIPVEMTDEGPDMEAVERLVAEDDRVKGMWIVPKYSNPTGVTVSSAVVERLAGMKAKAPDFRLFWDNAYAHHHLTDSPPRLENILEACRAAGNANRPFLYGSTSKISFAGAGIAAMAGSEDNIAWMREHRSKQTIGPDKLDQLRHVRFFENMEGVAAHMKKHAALIKPKFEAARRVLARELDGKGLAAWTDPPGGYFISLNTMDGCAKAVVDMAGAAGVKLTKAGATFPYGRDPNDRNIRIAPTLPSVSEIETAMEVVAVCIQRVALDEIGR